MTATIQLRVGPLQLLLLGPTWSSGPDHESRLDEAAGALGLRYLRGDMEGGLAYVTSSPQALGRLFVPVTPGLPWPMSPHLLPKVIRDLIASE